MIRNDRRVPKEYINLMCWIGGYPLNGRAVVCDVVETSILIMHRPTVAFGGGRQVAGFLVPIWCPMHNITLRVLKHHALGVGLWRVLILPRIRNPVAILVHREAGEGALREIGSAPALFCGLFFRRRPLLA